MWGKTQTLDEWGPHQSTPSNFKPSRKQRRAKQRARKDRKKTCKSVTVEIGNISNFIAQKKNFEDRKAHIFLGQEHSVPANQRAKAKKSLDKKWRVHMGDLDPELEATGGVFAMALKDFQILTPAPVNKDLKELNGKGRVQLYGFEIGHEQTLLVYNVYGWTRGSGKENARG